jgi:hypothetical protein
LRERDGLSSFTLKESKQGESRFLVGAKTLIFTLAA